MNDLATSKLSISPERLDQFISDSMKVKQAEIDIFHFFGPGIYIKECRVHGGVFAVGELHRGPCTNVLVKGRVSVANQDGSFTELVAPMTFVSPPGRKIGYFHEDTIWQNIYATEERDIGKLEDMLLDRHPELIELNAQKNQSEEIASDRNDYKLLLSERGMTEDQVKVVVENESDMIPLPFGSYKFTFDSSPIHGRGVFAVSNIGTGEIIGPARIGTSRTPLGRLTNHSIDPNAYPVLNGKGEIVLIAKRQIKGCSGGIKGEEITLDYRESSVAANMLDKEITPCLHS